MYYNLEMLTIPSIKPGFGPWNFKSFGPAPKLVKFLTEEIVKITLVHEKIKKKEIFIEILFKKPGEIAIFHKKFLGIDGPTDTISLCLDNTTTYEPKIPTALGTILLCWPVLKDDAEFINKEPIKHLAHIVVHSTLHLLGYNHENEQDRQSMEAKEVNILAKLGVSSPYLGLKMDKEIETEIDETTEKKNSQIFRKKDSIIANSQ